MKNPFKVLATTLLAGVCLSSTLTPAFAVWRPDAPIIVYREDEAAIPSVPSEDDKPAPVEPVKDEPIDTGSNYTPFKDVQNTRYLQAVRYFYEAGVVKGITGEYFGINESIKRVDAAVMMGNVYNLEDRWGTILPFKDVPARAIEPLTKLYSNNAISGKTSTSLGSELNITRGEAAIILYNAFKGHFMSEPASESETDWEWKDNDRSKHFNDVSGRYVRAVDNLYYGDVVKGIAEGEFGTDKPITRGELLLLLYRVDQF